MLPGGLWQSLVETVRTLRRQRRCVHELNTEVLRVAGEAMCRRCGKRLDPRTRTVVR